MHASFSQRQMTTRWRSGENIVKIKSFLPMQNQLPVFLVPNDILRNIILNGSGPHPAYLQRMLSNYFAWKTEKIPRKRSLAFFSKYTTEFPEDCYSNVYIALKKWSMQNFPIYWFLHLGLTFKSNCIWTSFYRSLITQQSRSTKEVFRLQDVGKLPRKNYNWHWPA